MTREIKFRAWDKDRKRWFNPDEFRIGGDGEIWFSDHDRPQNWGDWGEQYELMQYTGLKDKNGVEIYEGDIVMAKLNYSSNGKTSVSNQNRRKLVVEWVEGSAAYHLQYPDNIGEGVGGKCSLNDILHSEIIGNIYENKELLNA